MDLFDVARSCLRRWYVTIPLLVVTVLLSAFSYMNVATQYYGSTVFGISPAIAPNSPDAGLPANGLMDSGGISLVSNLLALGLQDQRVRDDIDAQGGIPGYEVAVYTVPGGQLPLVTVAATGSTSSEVERTIELVTRQSQTTLKEIQDNARVPSISQTTTYEVRPPAAPEPRKPARARTTVAIFVLGVGLSILIGVVSDIVIKRIRLRKAMERDQGPDRQGHDVDADPDPAAPRHGEEVRSNQSRVDLVKTASEISSAATFSNHVDPILR